ncbi:hypothetical protein ACRAWB_15270 [Leifsonia poae]|uniref:hypothetical protein n=1 Tax=Leifsonia poae TaxID=110933 RepID=UPI003D68F97B
MANIDDSTQTPPGYWFRVIEGRLHQRMRDALADQGLRRGSWRILHTLADGPATADELAARLPHGDEQRGHGGHGQGRRDGYTRGRGYGFRYGWRSQEPRDERVPGADRPGRPENAHDAGPEQRPEHHHDEHHHGDHGFERAFERGYARGFDRGVGFAAARFGHAVGPFPGGHGYGAFPGGHGYGPFPGAQGYGPFPGGHGYAPWGADAGRAGRPFAGHRHGGPDRGMRRAHRIQRTLADFVERGWVWFDGDRATLTGEGRAAHDRAFERVQEVRAQLADGISESDYATAMTTLETMARNLGWRPSGEKAGEKPGEGDGPQGDAPDPA